VTTTTTLGTAAVTGSAVGPARHVKPTINPQRGLRSTVLPATAPQDSAPVDWIQVRRPTLDRSVKSLRRRKSDNNSVLLEWSRVRSSLKVLKYVGRESDGDRADHDNLIQCINTWSDLESCGGCPGARSDDGSLLSIDCTSLPNVNEVSCTNGICVIGKHSLSSGRYMRLTQVPCSLFKSHASMDSSIPPRTKPVLRFEPVKSFSLGNTFQNSIAGTWTFD
jgi:hypothetical protein